ncbi:alpha/beta fold hydrolase [Streptomyces sp. NPDC088746]|uniref:alpha/beta fold hydrolase n=1 Tax=Streptomyces sp. NPDC088746 TaxID=3365885 RepID=UPI0037F79E5B
MTTVVFTHGTGVREPHLTALLTRVTSGLAVIAPDARVVAYDWGGPYGAALAAGGASIPAAPGAGTGRSTGEPDGLDETDEWARLYEDPSAELATASAGSGPHVTPPGAAFPDERPRSLLRAIAAQGEPQADALGPGLREAASELVRSPLLRPAAEALDQEALAWVLARALAATVIASELVADRPALAGGDMRDAAVAALAVRLGAAPAGTGRGPLLRMAGRPLVRLGSRYAVRRRRALTDAAHPAAGDILKYLARGEDMRQGLRDLVAALDPPVVLLGHSLGGIVSLDTLISGPLPGVELLITVGSQGPFLYETGALPSLAHPDPLPDHVPPWLNLYDRRDLLGYAAEPLFPGRAQDVATDSRQPFPVAHSAYWTDPAVYRAIGERLP